MSFRKVDWWIGRHMSARGWVVAWSAVTIGGGVLCGRGWWAFLGAPMVVVGVLMFVGNARRL